MIIFCSGLKRSGSTMLYNAIRLSLLASRRSFKAVGYRHAAQLREEARRLRKMSKSDTYYLIKTHDVSYLVENGLLDENIAFCSFRDPLDIARSGIKKFCWSQDEANYYLEEAANDLRQLRKATAAAHLVEFEWFSEDPQGLVDKVDRVLGLSLDSRAKGAAAADIASLGEGTHRTSWLRVAKEMVLGIAIRLKLNVLARRIGISPGSRQKMHFFLKGVDRGTLMHIDHRTGSERAEISTESIELFLASRPDIRQSFDLASK